MAHRGRILARMPVVRGRMYLGASVAAAEAGSDARANVEHDDVDAPIGAMTLRLLS